MPSRLERLILLDQELRRAYYPSVERLCNLFEVQPRTLYQDIKDLREKLGLDIRFDRARGGYYNADPEKKLPAFSLTDLELFSLFLGAVLVRAELDTAGQRIVEQAIRKLCAASPLRYMQDADHLFNGTAVLNGSAMRFDLRHLHEQF